MSLASCSTQLCCQTATSEPQFLSTCPSPAHTLPRRQDRRFHQKELIHSVVLAQFPTCHIFKPSSRTKHLCAKSNLHGWGREGGGTPHTCFQQPLTRVAFYLQQDLRLWDGTSGRCGGCPRTPATWEQCPARTSWASHGW